MPDCIIVAAGSSSRMQCWKPALPWTAGKTVLETIIDSALVAGCRVILVGGFRFRTMKKLIIRLYGVNNNSISLVRARQWRIGMDMSIRRGIREVKTNRFFVVPVDMPLIQPDDFQKLADDTSADIIRPVYEGIPGHPVLVPAKNIPFLLTAEKGIPYRSVLKSLKVRSIEWQDKRVIADMDTLVEYQALRPEK